MGSFEYLGYNPLWRKDTAHYRNSRFRLGPHFLPRQRIPYISFSHQQSSPGSYSDGEQLQLRNYFLKGFPTILPASPNADLDWEVAKIWDDELTQRVAQKPSTMKGFAALFDLFWISGQIALFYLVLEQALKRQTKGKLELG